VAACGVAVDLAPQLEPPRVAHGGELRAPHGEHGHEARRLLRGEPRQVRALVREHHGERRGGGRERQVGLPRERTVRPGDAPPVEQRAEPEPLRPAVSDCRQTLPLEHPGLQLGDVRVHRGERLGHRGDSASVLLEAGAQPVEVAADLLDEHGDPVRGRRGEREDLDRLRASVVQTPQEEKSAPEPPRLSSHSGRSREQAAEPAAPGATCPPVADPGRKGQERGDRDEDDLGERDGDDGRGTGKQACEMRVEPARVRRLHCARRLPRHEKRHDPERAGEPARADPERVDARRCGHASGFPLVVRLERR
jgi:hypothetical protein